MAPAAVSLVTAVASYGETKFSSMREAQRVGCPSMAMLSFTAMGMPPSGLLRSALAAAASAASVSQER